MRNKKQNVATQGKYRHNKNVDNELYSRAKKKKKRFFFFSQLNFKKVRTLWGDFFHTYVLSPVETNNNGVDVFFFFLCFFSLGNINAFCAVFL